MADRIYPLRVFLAVLGALAMVCGVLLVLAAVLTDPIREDAVRIGAGVALGGRLTIEGAVRLRMRWGHRSTGPRWLS